MFFRNTFITLACLIVVVSSQGPQVEVEEGKLRGSYKQTKENKKFSAFEGIPFAEAPINELRFSTPKPIKPWKGVKEVNAPHTICPQRDVYRRATLIEGEEDCLYLNVYTPQLKEGSHHAYPVMIFFHGGGWLAGGGNSMWYGPERLLDRDVILVVPNYRLGPLGFLSTGDEIVPGNNGMKDQNLAMRWVKRNIKKFGGDPNKVTLFGESAGGTSVQLHMVSPLSQGLFQNAISQSGTAHCSWAVSTANENLKNSRVIAEELGCSTKSSKEMVECLRKIPAYDIIAKDSIFMKWDIDPMIPFKPVIEPPSDNAFLVEHPSKSMKKGKFAQVPWMIGLNANDGALRACSLVANKTLIEELNDQFDEIVPVSLMYDNNPHKELITKKIREFYFGDGKIDETSKDKLVDMYTDGWFLNGADESIRYYLSQTKQPVYFYLFGHRGPASFTEIFGDKERDYGVCHADELQYLFPIGDGLFPDKPLTSKDNNIVKIMTTLWTNFAKAGDPTPETDDLIREKWTPVTSEEDMEYFHITEQPSLKLALFKDRMNFWRELPIRDGFNEIKDEL